MMKRYCLLLLVLCVLLTTSGCGSGSGAAADSETPVPAAATEEPAPASPVPEASPEPELSKRQRDWNTDLNYLKTHYKLYHIDPFYYCSEEEFDFKIDQLAAKVEKLSDNDIAFEIAAIIAGMGDIHTSVTLPDSVFETLFPIRPAYFGDKLYLAAYLKGYEQFEPYLMQEIVAVNGVDITYLQKKYESFLNPNNIWHAREWFWRYYSSCPAFYDWAGCDYIEGYTFQILNENGEVESVEVPVLLWDELDENTSWVLHEGLYALHYLEEGNWTEYFEEENGDYIYMSFTEMLSLNKARYQELFEATAGLIEAHPDCDKLVIDLRSHPGGQSTVFDYILEYADLLKAPSIRQTYVLIGGYTMSGAIGCIDIFKDELNAITVGEPTGQFTSFFAFRGWGQGVQVVLPISQIVIMVSNRWAEGANPENEFYDENGRLYEWENTILPDVFVSQDIEDIRQGKDSVIRWILEQG